MSLQLLNILIISLVVTFLFGLLGHFVSFVDSLFNGAFNFIQLPIETSLMALLVVTLTYASIRLLRRRLNLLSVIFLITALVESLISSSSMYALILCHSCSLRTQ